MDELNLAVSVVTLGERKYIHNVVIVTACRTDWHKATLAHGVK